MPPSPQIPTIHRTRQVQLIDQRNHPSPCNLQASRGHPSSLPWPHLMFPVHRLMLPSHHEGDKHGTTQPTSQRRTAHRSTSRRTDSCSRPWFRGGGEPCHTQTHTPAWPSDQPGGAAALAFPAGLPIFLTAVADHPLHSTSIKERKKEERRKKRWLTCMKLPPNK